MQKERPAVERVPVIFPFPLPRLPEREFRHPQQVEQVVFVVERRMPSVLDPLELLFQLGAPFRVTFPCRRLFPLAAFPDRLVIFLVIMGRKVLLRLHD